MSTNARQASTEDDDQEMTKAKKQKVHYQCNTLDMSTNAKQTATEEEQSQEII